MSFDSTARRRADADAFTTRWRDRGREKSDAQSFWIDLTRTVFRYEHPESSVLFEQGTEYGGWIDAVIPSARAFIEMKSRGHGLDEVQEHRGKRVTPFGQAMEYVNETPGHRRPRYIVVSNFALIRVYDLDRPRAEENFIEFALEDLADNLVTLGFLEGNERDEYETQVSWEAGEMIARLYSLLREQYHVPDSPASQHALNVICVRLVFCLFAEDALIFPKDSLYHYLSGKDPDAVRVSLQRLFKHLDTPPEERDPYATDLATFPFVNGGLFADADVEIPSLTEEIVSVLVTEASARTDWSGISPTIFGGVFESTLNPETRREGGMHYTSPQNIHRAIDPLFLDDLTEELEDILAMRGNLAGKGPRAQENALRRYQDKLAGLTFFDPACGSGNFLTETYICLRRLEDRVLTRLHHGQAQMGFEDVTESPVKVSLKQFHGIEVNDFAVSVAQTALWIAELQANQDTSLIVLRSIDDLPLGDSAHIVRGNALAIRWDSVVPPDDCDFIIGNPPFITGDNLSSQQKKERAKIFGPPGSSLDYVACWFRIAAEYAKDTTCNIALVATSSICQGQQVEPLWGPILHDLGMTINFAHRSFTWANETRAVASVHVVIVGYSYKSWNKKTIIFHDGDGEADVPKSAANINAYLLDAPNVYIKRERKTPPGLPRMSKGFQPTGGNLLVNSEDYDKAVATDPDVSRYMRLFTQARDFIIGKRGYIIWVDDGDLPEVAKHPFLRERITANRAWRHKQSESGDAYKLRDRPHRPREAAAFVDGSDYLLVPLHSSARRTYVPVAFVENASIIPGNGVGFIPTDDRSLFGIMISRIHTQWLAVAGGRIRADYRYGSDTVYNTFPSAPLSAAQSEEIADLASAVITERARLMEKGYSLEDMYEPDNAIFYPALLSAHAALDQAVSAIYKIDPSSSDSEIQLALFHRYIESHK